MNTAMFRTSFCAFMFGLTAIGCTNEIASDSEDEIVSEASQAINPSKIIMYEAGHAVPNDELSPLDPSDYNAELDCDVDWRGRIDLEEGSLIGGVVHATRGKYRQVFPGVFHATVMVGRLKAKTGGKTYHLNEGDSFLVTKGTEVVFQTLSNSHQASFFGNFASPNLPGTFKVYKKGSTVDPSELISLGTPADFGMVVLEGNPSFDARIDYAQGLESAGHFRVSRSKLFVPSTTVTEHGSVTKGGMTLTKPDGTSYTFHEGDAYLNRAHSTQTWQVNSPVVYQAFFGVFSP
jgi:uncharacterized cupin superfamily protein